MSQPNETLVKLQKYMDKDLKPGFYIRYTIADCEYGKGIFAAEDVGKGAIVHVQKAGVNLRLIEDEKELRTILEKEFSNNEERKAFLEHTFGYKGKIYQNLDDGKYINHSSDPNIYCVETFDKYVALKDIKTGDMLVENYHVSFENPDWLMGLIQEYGVDPEFY